MIDATKLPRPGAGLRTPGDATPAVQRSGISRIDNDDRARHVETYPAKDLVLDGGRYHVVETKK